MSEKRPLDSKQLLHFVCIVEEQSFSAAAQKLHISQPALTQSIKNLEATLNVTILDRTTRGVKLTEIGKHLLRHAERILNESQHACREIELLRAGSMGHVNIGLATLFTEDIIAPVVKRLNKRYPKLSLSITVGMFGDLLPDLEHGTFDFVFTNLPAAPLASGLYLEPLFSMHTAFMVGADNPLASRKEIGSSDIGAFRFATVKIPRTSDFLAQIISDLSINAVDAIETNSISLLKSLVLSGDFVSLMPMHLVTDEINSGEVRVLKVQGTPIERQVGFMSRTAAPQRDQVDLVKNEFREVCTDQKDLFVI